MSANPCIECGACCAHFRVSFHWSEAASERCDKARAAHGLPPLAPP